MPCPSRSPLSESRVSVSLLAVLVLCLHMALIPSHAPAMELPAGQDHILYEPIAAPVASDDPSVARPIGLGSVAVSGSVLRVEIELTRFSGPADIFVGVQAPAVDDDALYMLRPDNVLQPHTQGVVPWKEGVLTAGGESPFGEIPLSLLPPGRYTLYLAVTPPGDLTRYVLWETGFTVAARPSGLRAPRLQSLGTCDKVAESIRERLVLEMEKNVDLLKTNVSTYGWCTPLYIALSAGGVPSPPSPSAPVYSETNVQVPGVDEADFMKNDSAHIYILADGRFQIVEAWPPETSRVIASAAVEGTPKKLFVAADRALVYSSLGPLDTGTYYFPGPSTSPIVGPFEAPECVYGYDCDFAGDGNALKMTVFDIRDRTRPRLEREIRLDGSLLNARRIGTAVHTAVTFPPPPPTWSDLVNECFAISECRLSWVPMDPCVTDKEAWINALEGLKDSYRRQIASRTAEELLPKITDRWYGAGGVTGETRGLQCDGFFAPPEPDGQSFLSLVSLDIDAPAGPRQTTIIGRPGAVYASPDALYVASRHRNDPLMPWFYPPDSTSPGEASTVHKFSLRSGPAGSEYTGSGVIKGRVLNQFSLDEYDGYLRVATTMGHSPAPDTRSTVSVLREAGGELSLVGQLDGIAPSEDIRSARFFGDRGFIVTFKKTDPLFAIDLRDPLRPAIAGELKIPGFSTYMHFMDDRHLLSIGYDAEDMGTFSLFQGIMLQIFDVADPAAPRLLHKEVIGTRGTTSEAATNHLAFNYFKAKNLLALPATVCEGGSPSSLYGATMTFSGLLVYKATVQGGFARLGGVPHVAPGSGQSPQMCGSWWTVPNSVVKRSVFMDDYVYSVASDLIKVDAVNALGTDVSVIDLTMK